VIVGEDKFKNDLKTTPQQTRLIDALFNNSDFQRLWDYLKRCPAFTLTLKVTPGLTIGGVVRYGGYSPTGRCTGTLDLNPTKPEHVTNAAELVDTLVHELIHAICDAKECCPDLPYPLTNGETDWPHDSSRPDPTGVQPGKGDPESENKKHAEKHYGDGASDPEHEYVDENDKAQELIRRIVNDILKETARFDRGPIVDGCPTYSHKNLRKLQGPQRIFKSFSNIRSIVWEPDSCWQRTSTPRGWIMKCRCDCCIMLVSYNDGTRQVDFVGNGDRVDKDLDTLDVQRIGGFDKRP
jgi:hypothetical protein